MMGYLRSTALNESVKRQEMELYSQGVESLYIESDYTIQEIFSRTVLLKMLSELKQDDIILVTSLAVISPDVTEIIKFVDEISKIKCRLVPLDKKDDWIHGITDFEKRRWLEQVLDFQKRTGYDTNVAVKTRLMGRPTVDVSVLSKTLNMYYSNNAVNVKELVRISQISKSSLYNYIDLIDKSRFFLKNNLKTPDEVRKITESLPEQISHEFIYSKDFLNGMNEYSTANLNERLKKRSEKWLNLFQK